MEREGGRGEERVDVENVLDSDLFTDKSLQIPVQSGLNNQVAWTQRLRSTTPSQYIWNKKGGPMLRNLHCIHLNLHCNVELAQTTSPSLVL